MDILSIIQESFTTWYNEHVSQTPVSIVIRYNDLQTLRIKAYHTVTMEVSVLGTKDNLSFASPLLKLQENYNHGVITEEEAKEAMVKKLLISLYDYQRVH